IFYDLLSWGKSLPRHRMLSRAETLERLPGLNHDGLIGSALYYDAQVEFPERLVMENVSAARALGATVLTHTRVTNLAVSDGKVSGVEFCQDDETKFAAADVVINAAGPWIDKVLEHAPVKSPKLIGGTKGSHIIVPPFRGAPQKALYVEARSDG